MAIADKMLDDDLILIADVCEKCLESGIMPRPHIHTVVAVQKLIDTVREHREKGGS